MNRKTSSILAMVTLVICGLPGILSCLGGIFIAGFGLLADKAQLKLDTNLDQTSVVLTGMGGVCLGLILVAIPLLIWFRTMRHKSN
jgi:predicted ABC-type sugar transport system permease subunit